MTNPLAAIEETRPCGCVYRRVDEGVRALKACESHWIAAKHFSFMHEGWPGHEECCDVPMMEQAVAEHGRIAVERAIVTAEPTKQSYFRRVLSGVATSLESPPPEQPKEDS